MNKERNEMLLENTINYLQELIKINNGYFDTLDIFRKLGFNNDELVKYGIKDLEFENSLGDGFDEY